MIIVELKGGLGNQMFQYAFAKSLSVKHNQKLLIDRSFLMHNQTPTDEFTPRDYALDVFALQTDFASAALVNSFYKTLTNRLRSIFKIPNKTIIHEGSHVAAELKQITFPALMKGYWQSADYFSAFNDTIRTDFTFKEDVTKPVEKLKAEISAANAVSVHIRRGDYLTNAIARDLIGTLDTDYYKNAFKEINKRVESPVFYIFSDAPDWAAKHFPAADNLKIVSDSCKHGAAAELYLMTGCKHHIIANSSFSWWGAWLGHNINKVVVAPKRWFAGAGMDSLSEKLIPAGWIRI